MRSGNRQALIISASGQADVIALRRVFVSRTASQQGITVANASFVAAAVESSLGYPRFGRPDILVKLRGFA
jgi:hypothetical protein